MVEGKALVPTRGEGEWLETIVESPKDVVKRATEQANALMDIVKQQKLYVEIEGRHYLYVEGWEVIGAFNSVSAHTDWVEPVLDSNGEIIAYEAQVTLYRAGIAVGSAIMACGLDEFPCRGKEGEAKCKAAKSAAQTWATSKAYRMNYSWVAKLAGFEPTPAEEMIAEERSKEQTKTPGEHYCEEHQTKWFKKGKMKWYAHPYKDESGNQQWCYEVKKPPITSAIDESVAPPADPTHLTGEILGKLARTMGFSDKPESEITDDIWKKLVKVMGFMDNTDICIGLGVSDLKYWQRGRIAALDMLFEVAQKAGRLSEYVGWREIKL